MLSLLSSILGDEYILSVWQTQVMGRLADVQFPLEERLFLES